MKNVLVLKQKAKAKLYKKIQSTNCVFIHKQFSIFRINSHYLRPTGILALKLLNLLVMVVATNILEMKLCFYEKG